jgi:hypothetical protein
MLPSDRITTSVSTAYIDTDRIVRCCYLPGAVVTIREAQEEHEAISKLLEKTLGQSSGLMMVDIRPLESITREAREFYGQEGSCSHAVALIIGSPLSRMIGRIFLSLNRSGKPLRLFTDEAQATQWLMDLEDPEEKAQRDR